MEFSVHTGICSEFWLHIRLITTRRARTWRWRRMRRYGELSRGAERSSPRQFFPDCTIAMCGYDFREGQVSWPLRLRENLGLPIGSLARTEPVGASVAVAGRPRREP